MANLEKQRFARAFNFLASTKNTPVDAVKMTAYYSELEGVPIEAIEATGYALGGEPSPYLPDAGTWKTRAQALAAERLSKSLGTQVRQLTSGRDAEQDEIDRTVAARNKFFDDYRALVGREATPRDHPIRTSAPRMPTFGCLECRDTGWQEDALTARVRHCRCWDTNPVLKEGRARRHVR